MHVKQRVYPVLGCLSGHGLGSSQVGGVVRAPGRLHSHPHDAQPDHVHTQRLQEGKIVGPERGVHFEGARGGQPGGALDDCIHPMEDALPPVCVNKRAEALGAHLRQLDHPCGSTLHLFPLLQRRRETCL